LNNHDKTINEKNSLLNVYNILKAGLIELNKSVIIYDIKNRRFNYPKIDNYFNENTIYKSFVYYCNFNNNLPIDDELKAICLDKPSENFKDMNIIDIISNLKSQGKNYDKTNFEDLLNLINKRNMNALTNKSNISNFEIIRNIITIYNNNESEKNYETLIIKIEELLDSYSLLNDGSNSGSLNREIKNYLISNNNIIKNSLLEKFKTITSLTKLNYKTLEESLNIKFTINDHNFVLNYLKNLINIFPNIITNKNINYNDVPKHWNLSEVHNSDIFNILKKYYLPLMSLNVFPEFNKIFELLNTNTKILIDLINNIYYKNNIIIKSYKKTSTLYSVFDEVFVENLYKFIFLNIIHDILDIANSDEFLISISSDSNKNIINEDIINYLLTFFNIMNQHYKLINNSYNKVRQNILIAKEKEKDLITEYLKDLSQEERDVETIFKNNKLEKWSKGLQKGLTQYVKENYDEERAELEKQAIKEQMLKKQSNVTDMNKEIYKMDIEEEMANAQEIEDEEYNMNNIPDDDDFDSDYEYD